MSIPHGMSPREFYDTFMRYVKASEKRRVVTSPGRRKLGWALRDEIERFSDLEDAVKWMSRAEFFRRMAEESPGLKEELERLMEEEE